MSDEPELGEWKAYRIEPSQSTLGGLLHVKDEPMQRTLIAHMRQLYFGTKNWKVAQHLSLLLAGIHIQGWPSDHLQAEYFAACARESSKDNPLAAIIAAWVHWHRRLPGAVLNDLDRIDETRGSTWPSERFAVEYHTLLAMSYAYQGQTKLAWEVIQRADAVGGVYLSAYGQLLNVLTPDDAVLEDVALRVAFLDEDPGARATKLIRTALQRRLLRILGGRNARP